MALLQILKNTASGIKEGTAAAPEWMTKHMSVTDEFRALAKDDELTDSLLPSTYKGTHDSAVSYGTNARLAGEQELHDLHVTMDRTSGLNGIGRITNMKEGMALRQSQSEQAMLHLYESHRAELQGLPMPAAPKDAAVAAIVESYRKSGYAENTLKRMTDAGMDSAKDVKSSKNYVPVQHDAHRIFRFISDSEIRFKGVAKAYGEQLAEQYPGLLKAVAREGENMLVAQERIGTNFLNTMKRTMQGQGAPVEGTTKEQLAAILEASGADRATIDSVLNATSHTMDKAGESKHLRQRVQWDMARMYQMEDGSTYRIIDGVNTNMEQVLKTYNNGISARVGLAKKGITNSGQLTERFNKMLEPMVGDPIAYAKQKAFLDNTKNLLLGRPAGDMEGTTLQAMGIMGRALHLKNSGIYNALDLANSIREFGFTTVMDHFKKGFDNVLKDVDVSEAATVTDIIKGRLINEGKLRTIYTHMDSGFQTNEGLLMHAVNTVGQSVKFLNGSEYVRRHHIGLVTSIQGELLEGLTKGNAKSTAYLKSIGMSDERITQLTEAINKHGLYDSLWPTDLADEVAARLTSSVDTLALQVRKGEVPSFLAYSSVGRIMLPYFSFVAASNNKILRKEYQRNGGLGVAQHMLTTAPLAYIAAAMANITGNKDATEDINTKALALLPALGYLALPINFGVRGEFGGTPVPFAVINSIPGYIDGLMEGDLNKMVKNSPVLAVTLPVRTVVSVLSDND